MFVGEKKKRERNGKGLFFQGWTHLAGYAVWDFCGCQVQLRLV
jgi:hypothetical protein